MIIDDNDNDVIDVLIKNLLGLEKSINNGTMEVHIHLQYFLKESTI